MGIAQFGNRVCEVWLILVVNDVGGVDGGKVRMKNLCFCLVVLVEGSQL